MAAEHHRTVKYIIISVLVIGTGVLGYFAYTKWFLSKAQKVKFIMNNGFYHGDAAQLLTLDNTYIDDWYNAARTGQAKFKSGTGIFNTLGGNATTA